MQSALPFYSPGVFTSDPARPDSTAAFSLHWWVLADSLKYAALARAQPALQKQCTTGCSLDRPLFAERGLRSAFCCLIDGFSESGALKADLDAGDGFLRLPKTLEFALFGVIEELLRNVARHAQKGLARIFLRGAEAAVEVEVNDGAPGLEAGSCGGAGLGIAGIKERLSQLGKTQRVLTEENDPLVSAVRPIEQ